MTQENIELRKLIATEGHILTNGEAYGRTIFLGNNDLASNWYEITEEMYEAFMQVQENEGLNN